jgi:hypothetical protein
VIANEAERDPGRAHLESVPRMSIFISVSRPLGTNYVYEITASLDAGTTLRNLAPACHHENTFKPQRHDGRTRSEIDVLNATPLLSVPPLLVRLYSVQQESCSGHLPGH